MFSRLLAVLMLGLWLLPSAVALFTQADLCADACPEDDEELPCAPLCQDCGCASSAPRLVPPMPAVAHLPASRPLEPWWPLASVHTVEVADDVFHPPRPAPVALS